MREASDIGTGGAAEPTELLQFLYDWLTAGADRLGESYSGFIRSRAYDTIQQHHGRLHPHAKGEHPQAGPAHAAAPGSPATPGSPWENRCAAPLSSR